MDVTGLVLAGGRGERVRGVDKGWIEFEGRPLIKHVIERLTPQVRSITISANRSIARYAELADVVTDSDAGIKLEEFPGPLAGLLAGMRRAHAEWIVIVPCDAPRFPLDLVERLTQAVHDSNANAACAWTDSRMQPTFALVDKAATDSLAQYLASGRRAMHRWLASLHAARCDFADADRFANINTHDDIDRHIA